MWGSGLYLPSDLDTYASGEDANVLTDPLLAADEGEWVKIDLTTSLVVARRVDPMTRGDLASFQSGYDLLGAMKSEEIQNMLYEDGAALEHALDQSAMDTYAASKVKYSV